MEINLEPKILHQAFLEEEKKYDQRVIDSDFLERWQPLHEEDQVVIYIGAFLGTKGCGELLAMAPSLIVQKPTLKFIFCGFGTYREHLSQLLNVFEEGNL